MNRRRTFVTVLAVLGIGMHGLLPARAQQNGAPLPDEVRALADRAITNQHRDDLALETYERIERHVTRGPGGAADVKVYRVVPTGTGTLKLLLEDNGKAVAPAAYREELRAWEQTLEQALHPSDDMQPLFAKAEKRRKDRGSMVDAVREAFRATWLGRETRDGHMFVKIGLEPNPQYQPTSTNTEVLTHARVTLWIDEKSGHLARAEVEVIRDIYIGLGFFGKVNRGGHLTLEQQEVAPGVWLPVRLEYSVSGRKFLFGFTSDQSYENSHYRNLGPPAEAIAVARKDLAAVPGSGADR
jgi:hypothetical protein